MNLKIILLITLTGMVIAISNANTISSSVLNIQQRAEDALQKQMIKSSSDPNLESNISSCHSYYSEIMQSLLETYAKNLRKCQDIEREKLGELLNEGQLHREITTKSLNSICADFEKCKAESDNLNFFDCVDRSGDKSTRGIWKASRDSLDDAGPIREKIHDIKYQNARCSNEAERVYIIAITETTDEMMLCYSDAEEKDQVEEIEDKDQVEELETMFKNHYEF